MRTIVIAAALALIPAFGGTADAATHKAIWGPVELPNGRSAFPTYRHLGVDVFQVQLLWSQAAPTRPRRPGNPRDPAYRWPENVTKAVRSARRAGIRVAILVRSSPGWANGGRSSEWSPSRRHFARFLTAASRRYRSVRRWMIWGETNRGAVFQPLPAGGRLGPRTYARLLDSAYVALKRRSRRNIVVGGMTFSFGDVYPLWWLRWMRLPNGKPPRLDEYGHNPFTRTRPDIRLRVSTGFPGARDISDMDTFSREVRRVYRRIGRRPRLWLSEFTVSSDRPNRAFDFAVSRREQAVWLRRAFRIARKVKAAGIGWFNLHDEPASRPGGLTTGLMTYGGRRKPAYRAYRRSP